MIRLNNETRARRVELTSEVESALCHSDCLYRCRMHEQQLYRASSGVGELPAEFPCRNDRAAGRASPCRHGRGAMREPKSVEIAAVLVV